MKIWKLFINSIFCFSIIFFIGTCSFVFTKKEVKSSVSGVAVGGRLGAIQEAGTCNCGTQPPCLDGCPCGFQNVKIIPAPGCNVVAICTSPGIPTNGPPITAAATGNQILGLFSAPAPSPSTPLSNITGTSF